MKGKMKFQLGSLRANILGGPYNDIPVGYAGVKLAQEIDLPCTVDIPTKDYNVPDVGDFKRGLTQSIMLIATGVDIYAGCFGGVGRTGLYLAGMAKVMDEYRQTMKRGAMPVLNGLPGPISYVRSQYLPNAVETALQVRYIDDLFVGDIVQWWHGTQRMMQFEKDYAPHTDLPLDRHADKLECMIEYFECESCEEEFEVPDGVEWYDCIMCKDCDAKYAATEKELLGDPELRTGIYAEKPNEIEEFDQEVRIERLEGCVIALESRLRKAELALEAEIKGFNDEPSWWKFWK